MANATDPEKTLYDEWLDRTANKSLPNPKPQLVYFGINKRYKPNIHVCNKVDLHVHVHLNKMSLSWSTCGWLNLARLGSNFCGLTSRYIIILPMKRMTISGDYLRMNQSHVKLCHQWLFYCSDKCKHKKLIIKIMTKFF